MVTRTSVESGALGLPSVLMTETGSRTSLGLTETIVAAVAGPAAPLGGGAPVVDYAIAGQRFTVFD